MKKQNLLLSLGSAALLTAAVGCSSSSEKTDEPVTESGEASAEMAKDEGDGSCGAKAGAEGSCGNKDGAEGSCGADGKKAKDAADGSCGSGSCGGAL